MAGRLARIQVFAEEALACGSTAELLDLMLETTRAFGADYFLMIHHADFSRGDEDLVRVGNYPMEFMRISRQRGSRLEDPIMEACERTLTGFFWSDVERLVTMKSEHLRRVEAVRETGLEDGYVVPTHIPGEHLGSCHFATERGRLLPRDSAAALQTISAFGFEAARRLVRRTRPETKRQLPLTDRQRECIVLSAQGKSDTVIAQLLGLSPKTVNSYVEAAKKRFGVATRAQLIVSALYASEITFHDVVDGPRRGRGAAACN